MPGSSKGLVTLALRGRTDFQPREGNLGPAPGGCAGSALRTLRTPRQHQQGSRGRPEVGRRTGTEQDEEVSAPQPAACLLPSVAPTGGRVPRGSLPAARPHAPARRKCSGRKWIKNRKQLTSQRPSSWCILLYSHPLALNFPAAALSCFSIRGQIRESRQVATFLPGLSGLFFLQLLLPLPLPPLARTPPASFPGGWSYILCLVSLLTVLWLNPRGSHS